MKGIGFDFDHTLGIDNKLERTALLDILDGQALLDDMSVETCGEYIDEALHAYRSGAEMLDSALTDLFARCLADDYDPAEFIASFRERAVELAPKHIEARPGAKALFERLEKAGIRTAILTNGWAPLQQKKAELIGYTGPVIVSDDLGFRKPDGRAFDALRQTLDLEPADILYVGDAPAIDIAGALAAGMKAAWYDWEGHKYGDNPAPTYTIKTLEEILDLILEHSGAR